MQIPIRVSTVCLRGVIFVLHAVTAMMVPSKYGKLFKLNEYSCSYLYLWGCLLNAAGRRFSEGIFEDVGSICSANVRNCI